MESPVREGELLAGKYRVERVLGVGGMGVVVAARHVELHEHVALKFLRPAAAEKEELVERFMREARSATRIKSEHVVRVLDVGRFDNGLPYLVMEYLDGCDLGAIVAADGPMAVPDAVESVLQACEALAIAHAQGIVHRDIKPANLFLTRRPDGTPLVKLLDFGISKAALTGRADDREVSLTRSQSVIGSPLYMSPEAMQSARMIDARSDIWSLGVVLYELISASLAFPGESITQVCIAVMNEQPRPLRAVRPDVSPELERVVLRCLEKRPEDRYQTVADLAEALLPFAPQRSKVLVDRARAVLGPSMAITLSPPKPLRDSSNGTPLPVRRADPAEATWDALGVEGRSAPELTMPSEGTPLKVIGAPRLSAPSATAASAPPTERSAMHATPPSSRNTARWRAPLLGAVGLMAVAAFVFGARAAWRQPAAEPSPSPIVSSPPEPPKVASTFTLRVESQPPGATVFEGETAVGNTPFQVTLDNAVLSGAPRHLSVRKDGYVPYALVQGPSTADVLHVVPLVASPDAAAERTSPPSVRRPPKATSGPSAPATTAPEIRVER